MLSLFVCQTELVETDKLPLLESADGARRSCKHFISRDGMLWLQAVCGAQLNGIDGHLCTHFSAFGQWGASCATATY